METGIGIIAKARQKQLDSGYTPEHDLGYTDNSLAKVAACYAMPNDEREKYQSLYIGNCRKWYPRWWPHTWSLEFWKPTPENRIKELGKAGALIAAEIDRILATKKANT